MDATLTGTSFPMPDFGYGGAYGSHQPTFVKSTLGNNAISSYDGHNSQERKMSTAGAGVSDYIEKKDPEFRDPLNNFMMWNSQYMMPVEPASNVDDMMGYLEQSEPEADDDDEEDEDITDFNPPLSNDFSPASNELENDPFFISMQHTHRPSLEISCNAAHAAQLGLHSSTDVYHESPPYNCIDPSTLELRSLVPQMEPMSPMEPMSAVPSEDPLDMLLSSRPMSESEAYDVPAEEDIPQLEPLPLDSAPAPAPAPAHVPAAQHLPSLSSDNDTSGDDDTMDVDTTSISSTGSSPGDVESGSGSDFAYSPVSTSTKTARKSRKVLHGPHRCEMSMPGGGPCHKSFTRPYDLARHQETIHAQVRKMYTCEKCGENSKTFSRMDALSRHLRIKHPKD